MVTMERYLTEEEKATLYSGTQILERFTLGLYAPEFSEERSEVELELAYDEDSDHAHMASQLAQFDTELIENPCQMPGVPYDSGSLAFIGSTAATISALATIILFF